ncbi:MAG: PilZ domain-containing protein [Gemmataceae bacterium]|nr:PilZ domain-containing protein [Gemmataceae bacterium]MDW8266204.1 PilZ domain-containing protein [Gemmataceae bacterium]
MPMSLPPWLEHFLVQHRNLVAPAIGVGAAIVVFLLLQGFVALRQRARRRAAPGPILSPAATEPPDPYAHGSVVERRASLRRSGNAVAVLISDAEATAKPYSGWVVDRSMGGLCLSVQESVAPGTILSVRAANAPSTVPWVQVEVRNCRQAGLDWEIGCRFV